MLDDCGTVRTLWPRSLNAVNIGNISCTRWATYTKTPGGMSPGMIFRKRRLHSCTCLYNTASEESEECSDACPSLTELWASNTSSKLTASSAPRTPETVWHADKAERSATTFQLTAAVCKRCSISRSSATLEALINVACSQSSRYCLITSRISRASRRPTASSTRCLALRARK